MTVRRVVFLMSDSGGGHRAAADAIRAGLELRYPGRYTCELVDVYRRYTRFPFTYMPEIYAHWVNKANLLWGLGFWAADGRHRAGLVSGFLRRYWGTRLRKLVEEHPADVIVSVHTLFSRPMLHILNQMGEQRPPVLTVLTDLVTAHALAYAPAAERCLVPTEAAYLRGMRLGVPPERMQVTGLPVHPRFAAVSADKSALRTRLGWRGDLPVVLVVGGGEGMGPLYRIVKALNARGLAMQLVVIVGRNRWLQRRLERLQWHQPTVVYPFVGNMHELMAAADILVTKAGPATISEACAVGLPMILSGRVLGQEDGNVAYVIKHGAGCYAPGPQKVTDAVAAWLSESPERLAERAAAAQLLAYPHAAATIAEEIHRLAEHGPVPTGNRTEVAARAPALSFSPEDDWVL